MAKGTWEKIALAGLGADAEFGAGPCALMDLAHKLDRLVEDQRADAVEMARRFSDYANRCAEGDLASTPTGYSTSAFVAERSAVFRALTEQFRAFFPVVTGKRFSQVRDSLTEVAS